MEESKLPQSIMGAVASWILTLLVWLSAHVGVICAVFAIGASIYSMMAAKETIKLRKKQQRAVDRYKMTQENPKEPDTDT